MLMCFANRETVSRITTERHPNSTSRILHAGCKGRNLTCKHQIRAYRWVKVRWTNYFNFSTTPSAGCREQVATNRDERKQHVSFTPRNNCRCISECIAKNTHSSVLLPIGAQQVRMLARPSFREAIFPPSVQASFSLYIVISMIRNLHPSSMVAENFEGLLAAARE